MPEIILITEKFVLIIKDHFGIGELEVFVDI